MQTSITILQYILAIIGLSLIVTVHESGHFLMAKLCKIHVEEFFIGFGPKIFKFKDRRGTNYGICAIPLGGYNKILGMDRDEHIPPGMENKAFYNKPFYKKFLVVIGGIGFNIIFALLLVMIFLSMGVWVPVAVIGDILPDSPAETGGFKAGDEIIALNGEPIKSWDDFSAMTKKFPGEEVTYTVMREDSEIKIEVRLDNKDGEGYLGISAGYKEEKLGFIGTIKESFKLIWDITVIYVKSFGMLFSGEIPLSEARPVSPVGIVSIFQQSASMGIQNFIFFVALVSLLLGYGNLIPILPLDGGNIIFIIIESLRKKPVSRKVVEIASYIGAFILISLTFIALIMDIVRPFDIMNM